VLPEDHRGNGETHMRRHDLVVAGELEAAPAFS